MKYTVLDDFKELVIRYRKKKIRLRAIFLKLRTFKKFESVSDLILLNCIVIALRELGLPYYIREIYSAFKLVNKEDYPKGQKKKVLAFLTNGSKNKSVF